MCPLSSGQVHTGPGTLQLHSGVLDFVDGIGPSGAYAVGTTQISSAPGRGGGFLDLGGGRGSTGRLTSGGSGGGIRDGELRVGDGDSQLDHIEFVDGATVSFDPRARIEVGTVTVRGRGTLVLDGDITWSAGTWNVGGTSGGMSGGTVENRGRLSITGDVSAGCPSPCGGVIRNVSGATIDSRGASPLLSTPFVNNGTLTVSAGTLAVHRVTQAAGLTQLLGGMLIMHGDYVQTGGATLLDNGTLRMANASHTLVIQDGVLGGSGTIEGNVALSNNASLIPGLRQFTTAGNHQLGVLTIVDASGDGLSLGRDTASHFEIGGRARGTEYDAVVSNSPVTFSVGGTLSVLLVNGFESTISRNDQFVIFETALNPIRGSFFNVANGGRFAAMNTNRDVVGTFSVHYGSNSTDPTKVVLKDFDTTIIILPDPQNLPDSRAFFPSRNDKSGVIEVAAIVQNAPLGATYHWTRTDVDAMRIDSPGSLQTLVRGLKPGKRELDFTVRDSSGVPLASRKLQLSIPQFVTIDEDAAAFDAMLAAIHLDHVKNNVIEEAKQVCDHLLRTSNVRTVWRIGPFSEALPAHLPVATHVTTLTIGGAPPADYPDVVGLTYFVGGAIGTEVFNEPIGIFPDGYVHPLGSIDVDPEILTLVSQLENQILTDPTLVPFAIKVVGRLIGETMAHEIVHSLLGEEIGGPGDEGHNRPGTVANDLMNGGEERSFTQTTGLEHRFPTSPVDPDNFVDHGIAAIGGLQAVNQGLMDARFPVPPRFR